MFHFSNLKTARFGKQTYASATDSFCFVELINFLSHGRKLIVTFELQYNIKLRTNLKFNKYKNLLIGFERHKLTLSGL